MNNNHLGVASCSSHAANITVDRDVNPAPPVLPAGHSTSPAVSVAVSATDPDLSSYSVHLVVADATAQGLPWAMRLHAIPTSYCLMSSRELYHALQAKELAEQAKQLGNAAYKAGQLQEAFELYMAAAHLCSTDIAIITNM